MKKIICIKELPGIKVGDLVSTNANGHTINKFLSLVDYLIQEGFCEYVEEKKSLKDKWVEYLKSRSNGEPFGYDAQLIQIAKDHMLEVFDKAINEWKPNDYKDNNINRLRKTLEDIK